MDVHGNGLGRVIGRELRCIPPKFLDSCWGLKWCPKYYARGPSEFDIGILTPDGKYISFKIDGSLAMECAAQDSIAKLKPASRLPNTIHRADGELEPRRRDSPPSRHFSVPASPMRTVHKKTQVQPDFMYSHVTPAHSSAPLIVPGRMEGTPTIPIPRSGLMLSPIKSLSGPYTSELSYALLPEHSSHLSQNCDVQTSQHLYYLSPQIIPAVSPDSGALLYGIASQDDASSECLVSDRGDMQAHYLPLDSINTFSTPQVHVLTPAMQTPQNPWNNFDFSPASTTPMTCSTSFSTDSSLIGEFEQHHGPWVATPMSGLMRMDLENSPQSNDQSEAGMTDEYWQLHQTLPRFSSMHQSRGLSPIDMGVDQLPGTGEGEETAYNPSDTFLFSTAFHGAFAC
ncbi:hypothetical protein EDD22DRAFT_220462 [Suillus occidentalis]|nr:hypothetical protein EDD22DRAFT_220462 [Suillus occidentalis]